MSYISRIGRGRFPLDCEKERVAEVPKGLEDGVGKDAYASIELTSTSRDVSTGASLHL